MAQPDSILGLAQIRASRGISLEQIADSTKISVRSLKAIEAGEFKKLPGGIYDKSYIRQYCRAIDFDEAVLLGYYYRATGEVPAHAAERVEAALDNYLRSARPAPFPSRS
jgi:cytoskeletal protein RodZ